MRRILVWILLALVLAAGASAVALYTRVTELEHEAVGEDVFVLRGMGGNVGVLRTAEGPVVVDSMTFRIQGARIRERAEQLAGGPIQALLNTHYHIDHSHGNPGFAPGTRVVATGSTRRYMLHFDAGYWEGAAAETLPNELFEQQHELRIGGKTIRAIHPGPGHTGGDLVVLFVEDRVLHAGDLFFHQRYPNIDLEAGGSVQLWIETLDRVLELDFDRVIPGHGPTTDKEGLRGFQRFLRQLWSAGETAAREGRSLEELRETADLSEAEGYGVIAVPLLFRLDRNFVLQRVWEEATGAVQAVPVPD